MLRSSCPLATRQDLFSAPGSRVGFCPINAAPRLRVIAQLTRLPSCEPLKIDKCEFGHSPAVVVSEPAMRIAAAILLAAFTGGLVPARPMTCCQRSSAETRRAPCHRAPRPSMPCQGVPLPYGGTDTGWCSMAACGQAMTNVRLASGVPRREHTSSNRPTNNNWRCLQPCARAPELVNPQASQAAIGKVYLRNLVIRI
jgi:hypothetical protein